MTDSLDLDYEPPTFERDGVKCPHCGEVDHDDLWETYPEELRTYATECGACGKPFTVRFWTVTTYCSEKTPSTERSEVAPITSETPRG